MSKEEVRSCLTGTHGFKMEGNQYEHITQDLDDESDSNIAN